MADLVVVRPRRQTVDFPSPDYVSQHRLASTFGVGLLSMTAERQRSGVFDTTRNLRRTNFRSKVNRSEEGGDLGSELFGRDLRAEPTNDVALTVDEELLEVPRDGGTVTLLRLQPDVQIAGTITVDFDLGKHRECRVVLRRGELEDLGVGARLL